MKSECKPIMDHKKNLNISLWWILKIKSEYKPMVDHNFKIKILVFEGS